MKKPLIILMLALLPWVSPARAADQLYLIRADGMACAYCAYGIEKKFKQIQGVVDVDIDMKQGLVRVTTGDEVQFSEDRLKKLFADAGFTFRNIQEIRPIED